MSTPPYSGEPGRSRASQDLEVEHLLPDLGRRAANGGVIAVAAQALKMVLQLATTAIMARLLAPEDFGLVAMAATVTVLGNLFTDLGLSAATVQRKEIDHGTVSALFYVNMALGLAVMAIAMAAAPIAAWGFGDERISWIVIGLALQIPLTAAAAQHSALLQRGMRWVAIQWTVVAGQFAGATIGILLAWQTGIGYWALVVQAWAAALVTLVLVWSMCPWRPGRVTDWAGARSALAFGLHLTGFQVLNYFNRQSDNVLIGWHWGATELGYYTRAYTLLMMPLSLINGPVGSAMVPALSRMQGDPERWRKAYLEALGAVTLISSGLTAVMIAAAEPLVELLLGPGWSQTATIFALLSLSMFAATPMNTLGWIYVSLGRTKRMFTWGLIATPMIVASIIIGLPFGAVGVALSYSCAVWALTVPGTMFAVHDTPVSLKQVFRVVALPTAAGLLAIAAGIAGREYALDPPLLDLIVTSGIAAVVYVACAGGVLLLDPDFAPLRRRIEGLIGHLRQYRMAG